MLHSKLRVEHNLKSKKNNLSKNISHKASRRSTQVQNSTSKQESNYRTTGHSKNRSRSSVNLASEVASHESDKKKQSAQTKSQNGISMSKSARVTVPASTVSHALKEPSATHRIPVTATSAMADSRNQSMHTEKLSRKSNISSSHNAVFELCTSGAIRTMCQSLLSCYDDVRFAAADTLSRCNDAAHSPEGSVESAKVHPATTSLSLVWNAALIEQVCRYITITHYSIFDR